MNPHNPLQVMRVELWAFDRVRLFGQQRVTVVNRVLIRSLPQFFPASINRHSCLSALAKSDRLEYLKRSLLIVHIMQNGDMCVPLLAMLVWSQPMG